MKNKIIIDSDLEDLIPKYLENRGKDIEELNFALGEGDFKRIKFIGHSLKGIGSSYGFDFITDIGAKLENSALNGEKEYLKTIIEELNLYLNNLDIFYE